MRSKLALLAVLALAGCPLNDCDNPSNPTPTSTTSAPPDCQWMPGTPASSPECRPPRVDAPFSLEAYRGALQFGLGNTCQDEEDVLRVVNAYMARGWNTFEICSETEFWDEGCGDYPRKPRDAARLAWLLDVIARVPGAQVMLIGNCTLKRQVPLGEQLRENPGVSAQQIEAWHRTVARVVREGEFKNVMISTHNEFDNCRSRDDWGGRPQNCAGKEDVAQHIRHYREAGIEFVTADDSFSWPRPGDSEQLTYGFRLANVGARPASFHPDREKSGQPWDPSPHMLERLADFNGTYILSETVAWMDRSGRCDGLRTCDQNRINAFIARCAAVSGGRCKFTFHSENGLAGEVPTWIPDAAGIALLDPDGFELTLPEAK